MLGTAGKKGGGRGVVVARAERVAGRDGGAGGGGFDGVTAAWLVALTDEDVFRKIVRFL